MWLRKLRLYLNTKLHEILVSKKKNIVPEEFYVLNFISCAKQNKYIFRYTRSQNKNKPLPNPN